MRGTLYNNFPIINIKTSTRFFGVFYIVSCTAISYVHHVMHTGEPEENEKVLFLLTSLMTERDNLAHTPIYEEFQVCYIIIDVIL